MLLGSPTRCGHLKKWSTYCVFIMDQTTSREFTNAGFLPAIDGLVYKYASVQHFNICVQVCFFSALEALRNALYKFKTYLLTYFNSLFYN